MNLVFFFLQFFWTGDLFKFKYVYFPPSPLPRSIVYSLPVQFLVASVPRLFFFLRLPVQTDETDDQQILAGANIVDQSTELC